MGEINQRCLGYLSRREHSAGELLEKLSRLGFDPDDVNKVLTGLKAQGMQSDERFTEAYVHHRSEKGYGPVRIIRELSDRGIDNSLVDRYLDPQDDGWLTRARRVREKRFGAELPKEYKEKARQSRFLQYRGFTHDQIRYSLRDEGS